MKSKWSLRKAKEKKILQDEKFLHKSAAHAFKTCTIVALYCMSEVFGERASNPKLMKTMDMMYRCWEDIGDKKLTFSMLINHMKDEHNIWYDEESGSIVDHGRKRRKRG